MRRTKVWTLLDPRSVPVRAHHAPARGGRPIWRVPDEGFVLPRLQEKPVKGGIGFVDFREPVRFGDEHE